ncbi:helix-turn-helix domain-containing protein [Paraflavitalea speifideaquila]|uniref:helix-turn-helix domain-containing protein n=1 Tax=Paraflavitalea speifideaquila TaxID=3076558 RepID=UPI0028ED2BBC|nr:helix-turn-helix domain-containing protein [Paraflavitalea speifideiaquila]
MGVYSYLRLKRMEKAKELMKTGMPTRLIVEQIGYCYDSNFTKAFRKVYNETPAGWKKVHSIRTRRMAS